MEGVTARVVGIFGEVGEVGVVDGVVVVAVAVTVVVAAAVVEEEEVGAGREDVGG